jgi:hypothetical protein
LPVANCWLLFFKERLITHRPGALPEYSLFCSANQ